jgi:type IV pilus assembly protein PilP
MTRRAARALTLLAVPLALAGGCTNDQNELRAWMDQVRRDTQPIRDSIPEPKQFEPFRYDNATLTDPFSSGRLQLALDKLAARNKSGLAPDPNRRREPLENFPLESIRMVGHLSDKSKSFALLQAENLVYQAAVGSYAGQNYGKIIAVTESEVKLKELVQDAAGEWIERESALRLQEGKR